MTTTNDTDTEIGVLAEGLARAAGVMTRMGLLRDGERLTAVPGPGTLAETWAAVRVVNASGNEIPYGGEILGGVGVGCAQPIVSICRGIDWLDAFGDQSFPGVPRSFYDSLHQLTGDEFHTWRVLVADGLNFFRAVSTARLLCAS